MTWLDQYREKLQTSDEAVQLIKSGDRVYYGGNAAIPMALVRALAERYEELEHVQLSHVLLLGEDPLSRPVME
jgi:acyl-CoA hydrolase